jgi:hypothetical protein
MSQALAGMTYGSHVCSGLQHCMYDAAHWLHSRNAALEPHNISQAQAGRVCMQAAPAMIAAASASAHLARHWQV